MFRTITRPYKERSAEETIAGIREILGQLDLLPEETFHANPYPQIYSLSLELGEDKGGFRTNGKGRSKEYALASAYAEFLERMQNMLSPAFSRTIVNKLRHEFDFYYSPDETYLTEDDLHAMPEDVIDDLTRFSGGNRASFIASYFDRLRANGIPGVTALPFYDTRHDRQVYLPLNWLLLTVGSNGMAAGNTQAEAIFQAVCELLERWGAAQVFYNRLTPPTVPVEFLKQFEEEYSIIRNIERSGKYKVTVKDLSANKRVPSLGIIIENLEAQKYRLNAGSDTCFQVALSRCLTEVYQGMKDERQFDESLLDVPKEEAEYFVKTDESSLYQRYLVFSAFTRDGSGVFPKSLFGSRPDYSFDPGVFSPKASFEEEVHHLISNMHRNGHNVYIRDVSFLGFPSVFVYIPEVSSQGRKSAVSTSPSGTFNLIEWDKIEPLLFGLDSCAREDLRQTAQVLEAFDASASVTDLCNIRLKQTSPWRRLSVSFLLTQIWYRLGDLEKTKRSFDRFLDTRKDENKYYQIVGKYLELRAQGCSEEEVLARIRSESDAHGVVEIVLEDLSKPDQVFNFVRLPKCPYCSDCQLSDDCLTKGSLLVSRILYPEMDRHRIDQRELSWVIGGRVGP